MNDTAPMSLRGFMTTYNRYFKTFKGDPAIDQDTAEAWLAELADVPGPVLFDVIRRLARTSTYNPNLAKLNTACVEAQSMDTMDAYKKAKFIILLNSDRDKRYEVAPDEIAATVKRLGGWGRVGQRTDEKGEHWAEKRWREAWAEVHTMIAAGTLMSELLPAPRISALSGVMAGALAKGGE